MTSAHAPGTGPSYPRWRARIFAAIWLGYGAYYLCRVNISLAIPSIMDEFGLSKTAMGAITTSLFVAYAVGQLINGQLVDRVGGRLLIGVGAIASAVLCFAFGFAGAAAVMAGLWFVNGYFQAMGWTSTVKTMANWFPPRTRGHMSGWLGTSYQVGNAYAWLLAGYLVANAGWRWAFWLPAVILAVIGISAYAVLRDEPEQVGLPSIEAEEGLSPQPGDGDAGASYLGLRFTLRQSLANPRIWLLGIAFMSFQLVRYGLIVWAPTYLFDVQGGNIRLVTVQVVALPLAGSVGSVLSGWMTDRFFQSRRAPVVTVQLVMLAAFTFIFPHLPRDQVALTVAFLMLIGATTYGPDVLMAGALAMDVGTRKAAGSTAGLIDSLGYVGATATAVLSGWLADNYGWDWAFVLWAGGALFAAILMATMWNYRPPRGRYL
ncbi:MAG: MFS transporter [Armatimonadota bacterium]|nr:MAG: MFS transporter [Armatimonadota bacterium]